MYTEMKWMEHAKDGGVTWEVFEGVSLRYVRRRISDRTLCENLCDCLYNGATNYLADLPRSVCPPPDTERFSLGFCAGVFRAFVREVSRNRMLLSRRPNVREFSESGDYEANIYLVNLGTAARMDDVQAAIEKLTDDLQEVLQLTFLAFRNNPNEPAWEFVTAILDFSRSTYFLRLRRALQAVRNQLASMDND